MAIAPKPDSRKALELIVYIAGKLKDPTFHSIAKVLYSADHRHLSRYGKFMCADKYIAMKYGPVPSRVYLLLRMGIKGDGLVGLARDVSQAFEVRGARKAVRAKRAPDLNRLARSDLEALEEAIAEVDGMSFDERTQRSHGPAYIATELNKPIAVDRIAGELLNADEVLEHLHQ